MFGEITDETSFVRIEEEVRRFWRRYDVPEVARAVRRDGPPCVIYQQPLVAAGEPWSDQVRLLTHTDLMARYYAMRGEAVRCQAGWLCHGLQVETVVERSLGPDLADYDLARFNAACRDVAIEGMRRGEALAEWLGVWLDPAAAYATMTPEAIGAVWGVLRRLWDAGRLKHEYRVVSVCPRCTTPLSAMEASRRVGETHACSIWLRLPWDGESNTYFLAWVLLPWTLVGMVALAIHPAASYVLVEWAGEEDQPAARLLLAEAALERTLANRFRVIRRLTGRSLRGAHYRPLFTFRPAGEGTGPIILSETVPLDRGTGIVPVTPTFDAQSLAMAQAHDLPVPELLDDWGNLGDMVTSWRGLSPLDAEALLIENLQARELLFREQAEVRPHPVCPYCETSLLPLAWNVWLVETGSGPWVVGRDRAWGAPLPVWVCGQCQEAVCLAGLDDLAHRTGLEPGEIAPQRPEVDPLTFPCSTCGGTMRRVAQVVDAAFEAAVLPWATAPQPGPANLAVGLGDKHIGWLGDLAEVSALLHGSLAWEQALALPEREAGIALDAERTQPADALRWAAYTYTTPAQAERGFLRSLWRLVTQHLLAPPPLEQERVQGGDLLDRWLLARLYRASVAVTEALDRCDPERAARELAVLVDDISGWYAAYRPGGRGEALEILCGLLAPFAPHLAEAIHRQAGGSGGDSIHQAAWPSPDPAWEDRALLAHMALVRRLADLGRTARVQAGIVRNRPLRQASLCLHGKDDAGAIELAPFRDLLERVLGVARVRFAPDVMTQVEWRLALEAGQAGERAVAPAEVGAALANLGPGEAADMVSQLWDGLSVSVTVGEQIVTLLPDDVHVSVQARSGWAAAAEAGRLVVLEVD